MNDAPREAGAPVGKLRGRHVADKKPGARPISPTRLVATKRMRLHIGDVRASATAVQLQTLLGSCVAVCLHDPLFRIGGMNHILLPGTRDGDSSARFGVHAMELLINQLMNLGANRSRLVAKAFGGANVLPNFQSPTIGDQNVRFVRGFLAIENIPLIAERMGGKHAVQLNFNTDTGKASVHTVDGSRLPTIARDEESYSSSHSVDTDFSGDVTLF